MRNPELLCLGCMEELSHPEEICKKCGFDRTEYEKNRSARTLPSYTILVGKYLLGKVIGEGGFGINYLAWDLNRECKVAIKEYFPTGLATRDARNENGEMLTILPGEKIAYYRNGLRNFAEEGKNLARFQHLPGIVSVRDFFQDNGTAYIVMDYVEGRNLKQYLRKHYEKNGDHAPMEEKQILEMMGPVLQALTEIHKAGIIHRDISPENIICGPDGKITLIDFGAARVATGTETKSLTIMLKHGYAPEEQYRTHGRQGPWTDIYAICATMYQMASGYLPIESVERLYEDELKPLKQLNIGISEKISDVIEKGMAVRGEKRYQSVEEVYKELYPKPQKRPEPEKSKPASENPQFSHQDELEKQWEEIEKQEEEKRKSELEKLEREKSQPIEEKQHGEVEKPKKIKKNGSIILILLVVFCLFNFGGRGIFRTYRYHENFETASLDEFLSFDQYNEENPLFLSKEEVGKLQVEKWAGDEQELLEEAVDMSEVTVPDFSTLLSPAYTGTTELPKPEELVPIVDEDGKYGFVDSVGNEYSLAAYEESEELFESSDYFGDRYQIAIDTDEYGVRHITDKYGNEIMEDDYESISIDNQKNLFGLTEFLLHKSDDGYSFWNHCNYFNDIDSGSSKSRDFSIGKISDNGFIPIECNGKCGYVNLQGEVVIPLQYGAAKEFSDGLAPVEFKVEYSVSSEGSSYYAKWGYINELGEIVIPPIFDDAESFTNGMASVKFDIYDSGKSKNIYGFIDNEGNLICAFDKNSMQLNEFFKDDIFVEYMGQDGYCTEDGKAVIGAAKVIDDEICAQYTIVDLRGSENIPIGGSVVLGTFSKSGLIPVVEYDEVNAVMRNGGSEEEVMNAHVYFYYVDAEGRLAISSSMVMSCEEFEDFIRYFHDMYYGRSAEMQLKDNP